MNKKKLLRPAVIIPAVLAVSAITAAAFSLYRSTTRFNDFTEGSVSAQIKENNSEPTEAQTTELIPEPSEAGGEKYQVTAKKVTVKNTGKNDAYVRVKLVPCWVETEEDAQGNDVVNVVGTLGALSDFGNISFDSAVPATSIIFTNGVRCTLADEWSRYWTYNEEDDTFLYKKILGAGDITEPLISEVVLTDGIYQTAKSYNVDFRLDVLADLLQDEGELAAKNDRKFD
ncbi:MAG: hypothetical protein IJ874_00185 [Ruminococcus sp.]|nr:hypothetical protein [Ruminococcus sp.]